MLVGRCPWCGAAPDGNSESCPACGAPIGQRLSVTHSGWVEQPPIRNMARLRVGSSTCQIEGAYVPVADFNLSAGDGIYFAHNALLWKDPSVEIKGVVIAATPVSPGAQGGRAPMSARANSSINSISIIEATGPGHIAISRDEAGETIALPLDKGRSIDVQRKLFLAATSSVAYRFFYTNLWFRTRERTHSALGGYMDHFIATTEPGLVLLHSSGNVFVRLLGKGQTLLIKPNSLVYKDSSVGMQLQVERPQGPAQRGQRLAWLRLTGPGRVAIQSAYEPMEDSGGPILNHSAIAQMIESACAKGLTDESINRIIEAGKSQDMSEADVRFQIKMCQKIGHTIN